MSISRNDPCFCGSGKKQKKCHADIHPDSRSAHVIRLYKELDGIIEHYHDENNAGPPCKKGCYSCCYDDFMISEVEFMLIVRSMKDWSQEDIEDVFVRSLNYLERIQQEQPELYQAMRTDGNIHPTATERQKKLHDGQNSFPCPLLNDETKTCSVYEDRPFACRSHGSTFIQDDQFLYEDHVVCELIPSNQENRTRVPHIPNFANRFSRTIHCYFEKEDVIYQIRQYPIYYWFYILHKKNGYRPALKFYTDSHTSVAIAAANQSMIRDAKMTIRR